MSLSGTKQAQQVPTGTNRDTHVPRNGTSWASEVLDLQKRRKQEQKLFLVELLTSASPFSFLTDEERKESKEREREYDSSL